MANTNVVLNPSCTSTTGFSYWPSTGYVLAAASNELTLTNPAVPTNASNILFPETSILVTDNHKYYLRVSVKTGSTLCTNLSLGITCSSAGNTVTDQQASPTQGTYYTLSGIRDWGTTGFNTEDMLLFMYHTFASTADAANQVLTVKEIMCVDLTAEYGAGNEPSVATCDAWAFWVGEQPTGLTITAVQHLSHIDITLS